MSTTILPAPPGLRLLRAWCDADGWGLDDPLPVLALAFKPDDDYASPEFIVPGSAYALGDTVADRSLKDAPRDLEWADALIDAEGRVVNSHGQVFDTPEQWLNGLKARDAAPPA